MRCSSCRPLLGGVLAALHTLRVDNSPFERPRVSSVAKALKTHMDSCEQAPEVVRAKYHAAAADYRNAARETRKRRCVNGDADDVTKLTTTVGSPGLHDSDIRAQQPLTWIATSIPANALDNPRMRHFHAASR